MDIQRRQFLTFLGMATGGTVLGCFGCTPEPFQSSMAEPQAKGPFTPVRSPMPVPSIGIPLAEQTSVYRQFTVQDELVLPPGYTYDVIAAWGDRVGDSRFGYNNDYLAFVETGPDEGYLTVNFEYISTGTWVETYDQVIGTELPLTDVISALQTGLDMATLGPTDPLKKSITDVCKEALTDVGIGVISIRRNAQGRWERTHSNADRRISGISGLEDGRYLTATGPALSVFNKTSGQGYIDGLGDSIIGTFSNCAGGTTPWGTVLSAEENFQSVVIDPVYADGTAIDPGYQPLSARLFGTGSALGYAGNKYGWMVEVDPANPDDYGVKHTWLGRFRHEAVGIRAVAGQPMAVYSGCDRRGGHFYKFVSTDTVTDLTSKANSQLFQDGMLYAAKFNADGTGSWIPLKADTAVNPDMPSQVAGGMITLPKRPEGGIVNVDSDSAMKIFAQSYDTLGELYEGNPEEKQGAILIDAHYAANAVGATSTARPEDTHVTTDGAVLVAFTSGTPGGTGGPHLEIFQGPNGETPYEYGWIMKIQEDDPAAMVFRWSMLSMGGEPADGGAGFASPDNLEIDTSGNLWMVTDMATGLHNKAVESRIGPDGQPVDQVSLCGLYGNNSIWYLPMSGPNAGEAYMFGYGPMECEMAGPFITADETTLFLSAQHPGELNGTRQGNATETRRFAMKTTDGDLFEQTRTVPIGSNWPSKEINAAPRPAVVAIRKIEGGKLV